MAGRRPLTKSGMLNQFAGGAISTATGFAVGSVMAPTLAPITQALLNETWAALPNRPLSATQAADAVVRGLVDMDAAADEARHTGYARPRFDIIEALAGDTPGTNHLLEMFNRGFITDAQLTQGLIQSRLRSEWLAAVEKLADELLDPAQLAAAIHRGLVPDPGLLKGEQPAAPFKVEAYPVYPVDAVKEAKGSGYDRDRLGVLVGLQGLPMGTHEAAQALFRGIITHGDYIRAFNESNSRNEWAAAVLDQSRQIPTARDFLENALRGYRDLPEALKGAARHGMSVDDATMIYQNQGRPMAVRQITQALSRGGVFKPEPGEIKDPYDAAIVEGSLKPAYYDLAKSLRYTLPSPFAMRGLASSGVWDEAKTAQRLKDSGWLPEDADEVAKAWATPTAGSGSHKWADRARTKLFTVTHDEYLDGSLDVPGANAALDVVGVPAGERPAIFAAWDKENEISRTELTTAQIVKAYKAAQLTLDEAKHRLADKGITPGDADILLSV